MTWLPDHAVMRTREQVMRRMAVSDVYLVSAFGHNGREYWNLAQGRTGVRHIARVDGRVANGMERAGLLEYSHHGARERFNRLSSEGQRRLAILLEDGEHSERCH